MNINWIESFGDTLYDLCLSTLWEPQASQSAFRSIMRNIEQKRQREHFEHYFRPWIFKIAVDHLQKAFPRYAKHLSAEEEVALHSNLSIDQKVSRFELFFHRLSFKEKTVLLLRDKYGLPYSEIAGILSIPEESVKLVRSQALRALESSIWSVS